MAGPVVGTRHVDLSDPVLQSLINDLKNRTEEDAKLFTARALKEYVMAQSRELPPDHFKRWLKAFLKTFVWSLMNSPSITEKIGGLIAVDVMIDVANDYNDDSISMLANYLRIGLKTVDTHVMDIAAKGLGHLARCQGSISTQCVEFEMKRAMEWLQGERIESKRHAACLVLAEVAENAPALFYSCINSFVDLIWVALRDQKPIIRESAVRALRASLVLMAEREYRLRTHWYSKLFEEVQKGFKMGNVDALHASLLATGEMLRNTDGYLRERYEPVCQTTLRFRDSRERMIRKTVIALIPQLALFNPGAFCSHYLADTMNHLMNLLRKEQERAPAFQAVGEIALAIGNNMRPYLMAVVSTVKEALRPKSAKLPVPVEALQCIAMLAKATGSAFEVYGRELLDMLFALGLCPALIDCLAEIAQFVPQLSQEVQERLLDLLSRILSGKRFTHAGTPARRRKLAEPPAPPQTFASTREEFDRIVAMALLTLGTFNFEGYFLVDFARDTVVKYFKDPNVAVRKQAAMCCCKLAGESIERRSRQHAIIVNDILEKLLALAISDPDPQIRHSILVALDYRFNRHLSQAACLRSLFLALNDSLFKIRELALSHIGRLAERNPAYVLPSLRTILIHLLTEIDLSGDNTTKEESATLLGHVITAAPSLITPYVEKVMKSLLPKLQDPDPRIASCVLATCGKLGRVCGRDMQPYLKQLMPVIIDALQDQSSASKREVAIRTLGQLAESASYVVSPYSDYPKLLDTILNEIITERSHSIRQEVIKVFGILGALDPYTYKLNQLALEGRQEGEEWTGKTLKAIGTTDPASKDNPPDSLSTMSPSHEDYFATVAISALIRILRDPSLSGHHSAAVQGLMLIIKNLGNKAISFLSQVMPTFLQVTRSTPDPEFRTMMFQQLGVLIGRVKQNTRDYLPAVFQLITDYWHSPHLVQIVGVIEDVSLALNDEFAVHLPELLPQLLQLLYTDTEPSRAPTVKVLHALQVFGTNIDAYLHLVVPAVVRLCDYAGMRADGPHPQPRSSLAAAAALRTLRFLCKSFNVSSYAARLMHTLVRCIELSQIDIQREAVSTLCALVPQIGDNYTIFQHMVEKAMERSRITSSEYDTVVKQALKLEGAEAAAKVEPTAAEDAAKAQQDAQADADLAPPTDGSRRHKFSDNSIKRSWEVSQMSTRTDWMEWIRKFSLDLIRESPSIALRSCISLANDFPPLVKELFNASFVSCWSELSEQAQDDLVRSLETALLSPTIPAEILQTLLNLAEFMEQDEKPLPIDTKTLGLLAEKCHAYAKALHYKEAEFRANPDHPNTIEALISINNQLQVPDAALGILTYAQKVHQIELRESWYEKLQRWKSALQVYETKQEEDPNNFDIAVGRMRCLHALGEWDSLAKLCHETWTMSENHHRRAMASRAAAAAWNLGNWDLMSAYVQPIEETDGDGQFFRAVLSIHAEQYDSAQKYIDLCRESKDKDLSALVGESYSRAYRSVVQVQQLSELEEIITFKTQPDRRRPLVDIWNQRLRGAQRDVETWQSLLAVRSLVLSPLDDAGAHLKFSALCRKHGRFDLSFKTLVNLLGVDPTETNGASVLLMAPPQVSFSFLKHLWEEGEHRSAFQQLKAFAPHVKDEPGLQARIHLKLGDWQMQLKSLDEYTIPTVIQSLHSAVKFDPDWYKAWRYWALANYKAATYFERTSQAHGLPSSPGKAKITSHVVPAVRGFFKAIALAPSNNLQDVLRLMTLWFKHASHKEVETALLEGFNQVPVDTWLQVIPQLIARINHPSPVVRRMVGDLVSTIGKAHPQALVYSLTVATKSQQGRSAGAAAIMDKMRKHSAQLVEQAQLVSHELIRVSILWFEMWHEGLEEASRAFFHDNNFELMFSTLGPLHETLEQGPETPREVAFAQQYGRDLQDAWELCKRYERSQKQTDLNAAWELYYKVFRRINKQILVPNQTLELVNVSPKLLNAQDLEAAVPGTYRPGQPVVGIRSFHPVLPVLSSKQRPRKLIINGSDGTEYMFLLKGHEDLRQDERVMQLFGLVNTLLASEYETSRNHLNIQRYSVVPLSPNSGLIGWVPHCDTLHQLIRDYRESRKILINIEHRLMLQMAPDYDTLTLMQKVEAFEYALENTNGLDLERILWLKSSSSEVWFDRRTNYTRSLAVMSMVGYILGLGDRHPSNLMLDRMTGTVLHIDFGDCFEVAMHREKYPEKIPFRLTRMMINAMEVSGIEGTFRSTCESVLQVCRENKESLMAVLEAFVYDPIINWRLLTPIGTPKPKDSAGLTRRRSSLSEYDLSPLTEDAAFSVSSADSMPEMLNRRALQVINRVSKKLTGRDFGNETLGIAEQVQRVIDQATSHENLCECYVGWCPFW
eukprot:TRINITY_DN4988_c0_g1_i2.p1 TRINITY_DN4988_c0_g1~~TRINITY_DN4988_c0_g1_i2.p1  ORF type:complete len:2361 (-),score=824.80 TRINITY_DN4988_c0_g1_i2:390-7472(-)